MEPHNAISISFSLIGFLFAQSLNSKRRLNIPLRVVLLIKLSHHAYTSRKTTKGSMKVKIGDNVCLAAESRKENKIYPNLNT